MAPRPLPWQAEADALPLPDPAFAAAESEIGPTLELDDDGEVREAAPLEAVLPPDEDPWTKNLAAGVDDSKLSVIATDIIELVKDDIASRADWVKRFERGLALMGLKKSDLDDGPFPGAATVVHPVLTQACVQFWARAMPELFPSSGPAKGKVRGEQTEERVEAAERVADHMNYQMTDEDRGYRNETSRSLMAVGAHGGAYKKTFRNTALDTTQGIYVPAEDFLVPYSATSLTGAPRYTHRQRKTPNEVKKEMASGFWRNVELQKPGVEDETEEEALKSDLDAKKPQQNDKDARHEIYETYIDLHIPEIDKDAHDSEHSIELPYIVTIEVGSTKVLAIRRNWRQADPMREKRVYFTPYEFVPGFGFYPLGLFHLIGGLSEAATGALRALLDGAATASLQGGWVSKDVAGKLGSDGRLVIEPGVYQPLDISAEEMKNGFYSPPFKEPSTVLYQLLGLLIDSAKETASITESLVGEGDNTGPVGTTVALIEQGMKVFSTVHQGLHASMAQELRVRFEINKEYAPEDGYKYDVLGDEREVFKADYMAHSTDISPVSDPNIFSVTQRLAIAQATYQLSNEHPDIYDKLEVHRRLHQAMKTPDYEALLIDPEDMQPLDPIMENQCLLTQKPIRVFPQQDHASHIQVHVAFMQNPGYGGHPEVMPLIEAQAKAHIAQHLAALYAQQASMLGVPAGTIDFSAMRPSEIGTPEDVRVGAMAAQIAPQLMQIPGLPQMQGPEQQQAEDEHQQALRHKDEAHKQALKHADDDHQQALAQKAQDFKTDEKIKQVTTVADETRKDEAFVNEQARAEAEAAQEAKRTDLATIGDQVRKDATTEKEVERKSKATESEIQRKDQAGEAERKRKDEAARQAQQHKAADHAQSSEHKAQEHDVAQIEKALDVISDVIHEEIDHEQAGRHADEDHSRAAAHDTDDHKRAAKQETDDHKRAARYEDEDHERAARYADEDHKRSSKQSDESHKQALKQSKEKAKVDGKKPSKSK